MLVVVLVGMLGDVLAVAVVVSVLLAAARVPAVRRSPAGPVLVDLGRGVRRLFVGPAVRAWRSGVPPRHLLVTVLAAVLLVAACPWWARRVPLVLVVGRRRGAAAPLVS